MNESVLCDLLARYWGYRDFLPLQREAIEAVLAGRDSMVVLPTGGGKSLCFQLPALVDRPRKGIGLVISPLIALMKDQVDGLVASGVPAAALNSSLIPDERDRVLADLDAGACRLLYVSPERLVGEGGDRFRTQLRRWGVGFIAVDEAHCISQWGHDFRPEYRQLALLRAEFPGVALHAFTATATVRVRQDIIAQLTLQDPAVLIGSFDRPNLVYRVLPRTSLKDQIVKILKRHPNEAGIIYCISRREVEATAEWLNGLGHRALPYHAGLADGARRKNQEAFLDERVDIMVATVAFGMGIAGILVGIGQTQRVKLVRDAIEDVRFGGRPTVVGIPSWTAAGLIIAGFVVPPLGIIVGIILKLSKDPDTRDLGTRVLMAGGAAIALFVVNELWGMAAQLKEVAPKDRVVPGG